MLLYWCLLGFFDLDLLLLQILHALIRFGSSFTFLLVLPDYPVVF
jgi:hypothetical protein